MGKKCVQIVNTARTTLWIDRTYKQFKNQIKHALFIKDRLFVCSPRVFHKLNPAPSISRLADLSTVSTEPIITITYLYTKNHINKLSLKRSIT